MLEFDNFLEAIGNLTPLGIVPDEKPFSQFSFPFSGAWRILPSSDYGFQLRSLSLS